MFNNDIKPLNCPFCGSSDCPANCDDFSYNRKAIRSLNSISEFSLAIKGVR
jgi:hypothetical protein